MKLHVDRKKRGAIRKHLSILLVACMVLSNGLRMWRPAQAERTDISMTMGAMGSRPPAGWRSMGTTAIRRGWSAVMMESRDIYMTEIVMKRSPWLAAGWRSIMRAATKGAGLRI